MEVEVKQDNGVSQVELAGEIDLETSPRLRQILLDEVNSGNNLCVVMKDVSYIDSSGIASLVEAYQSSKRNQSELILAAISDSAGRVLQLARLDKVFNIKDTVEEAMTELSK